MTSKEATLQGLMKNESLFYHLSIKLENVVLPLNWWKAHEAGFPNIFFVTQYVATLTWPSLGVKPNTWKKLGFRVLRDSRMLRARQKGAKHLALGCSWCHWKGLET
jgi:hypothetical protein